jgi:hypothetical protein
MPKVDRFNYNDLPILGIRWVDFSSEKEAEEFAKWAEEETIFWEHPCEAFVEKTESGWTVKVKNW